MNPVQQRQRDLARIHLAKKELGLTDDAYRAFLMGLTGKASAKDLDGRERWMVLREMVRLRSKVQRGEGHPGTLTATVHAKTRLLAKIEAQLTEADRPWTYVNAMAKRMFKVDLVQWCDPDQLRRIVAALTYDAQRRDPR